MKETQRSGCPINLTLEMLGDRWSLIVIRDIMFGNRRRFRELLGGSEEGIASNILADRLKRLVEAGIPRIGSIDLDALIRELGPRAPVIDYSLEPVVPRAPRPTAAPLVAALDAFHPPQGEVDWSPLFVLVAQLLDTHDTDAIVLPLLRTLDRFHTYDGFAPFWAIANPKDAWRIFVPIPQKGPRRDEPPAPDPR